MEIVKATYSAKTKGGGGAKVETDYMPKELNQMIVWMMMHQEDAVYLLPEFERLYEQVTARNEGSAKNHGIEV